MDSVIVERARAFLQLYRDTAVSSPDVAQQASTCLLDSLAARLGPSATGPSGRLPFDECGGAILHALAVISTMADLCTLVNQFSSTMLKHCGLTCEDTAAVRIGSVTESSMEHYLDQLLAGFDRVEGLLPDLVMVIHALRSISAQHLDPAAVMALQIYLILKQSSNIMAEAAVEGLTEAAAARRGEEAAEVLASCCYSLLTSGPSARLHTAEQQFHEQAAAERQPPPSLVAWRGQLGEARSAGDSEDHRSHQPYCLQAFSLQLAVMQHRCCNQLHSCANGSSPGINALLLKVIVLTFQALGGQEHLLSAAFTSCLATLASDMFSGDSQPRSTRGPAKHPCSDWACTVAGERTLAVLAALPNLPSLAVGLLVLQGGNDDKQKALPILSLLEKMILGPTPTPSALPSFLGLLSDLLRPETSCGLDVRLLTIQLMHRAVEACLDSSESQQQAAGGSAGQPAQQHAGAAPGSGDDDGAGQSKGHKNMTSVWPTYAAEVVLFAVMHDPSMKVRRAAMRLLSTFAVDSESATAQRLCKTLVAKSFDKDALVQQRALELLLQLSPALVTTHCSPADMAWVLGTALAQCASSAQVKASLLPPVKAWLDRLTCTPGPQLQHTISNEAGNQQSLQPLAGRVAVECCMQDRQGPGRFNQGLGALCSSLVACKPDS